MFNRYFNNRKLNKIYKFNKNKFVTLPDNFYRSVFVFGSNLDGNHLGGAAAFARTNYGAKQGIAQGYSGNTYAIPTVGNDFKPLGLNYVKGFIYEFVRESKNNPHVNYYVTPVGTGIAGFEMYEIVDQFVNVNKNVILPIEFKEEILNNWYWYEDIINGRLKCLKK